VPRAKHEEDIKMGLWNASWATNLVSFGNCYAMLSDPVARQQTSHLSSSDNSLLRQVFLALDSIVQ
jgi:hypothetical protein